MLPEEMMVLEHLIRSFTAMITALGMMSSNLQRLQAHQLLAYDDHAFAALLTQYQLVNRPTEQDDAMKNP